MRLQAYQSGLALFLCAQGKEEEAQGSEDDQKTLHEIEVDTQEGQDGVSLPLWRRMLNLLMQLFKCTNHPW